MEWTSGALLRRGMRSVAGMGLTDRKTWVYVEAEDSWSAGAAVSFCT